MCSSLLISPQNRYLLKLRRRSLGSIALLLQQICEFIVGESSLANDALYYGFWDVKSLVIRNCHSVRLNRMLELNVRTGSLVDVKAGLLQGANDLPGLETAKSGHTIKR
jgi:hypothetical protein